MNKRLVVLGALAAAGCQGPSLIAPPAADAPAPYRVQQAVCPATPTPSVEPVPTPEPTPTFNPLLQRFLVTLTGAAEVPPRETSAGGQGRIVYVRDSNLVQFDIRLTGLTHVTAAHLHLGAPGENGPPVAFLYGPVAAGGGPSPGRLVGVLRPADISGPLADKPLAELAKAAVDGRLYVNVHTDDGVAPPNTGPGDFPDGEVRGQLVLEAD